MKNKILGFRKDKSRSKEISFFQQVPTKNIMCLKGKTCHYCQSLAETGSIPSKARVIFILFISTLQGRLQIYSCEPV